MAIASPTDFICVVRREFEPGELLEGEAWNLGDHVVDGRFEGRRRAPAGDLVLEFIERVTHRQLRGDFRDREARGLDASADERDTRDSFR